VWGLVLSIVVAWCVCIGVGMSLHDVLLSMLVTSYVMVSISIACTVYPYACVRDIFIVCWMLCGSSRVSAFEFATMYMFRLYFMG
jgi:hypothetical protein